MTSRKPPAKPPGKNTGQISRRPTEKPAAIRERLTSELLDGRWVDLEPHLERQAVFVVSNELDLVDVGVSIVEDNSDQVSAWVQNKSLFRPTHEQAKTWAETPEKIFRSLIVAPYVLIQELGH